MEEKVGNYVVDIVQKDRLIEVQTRNFSSIKNKLHDLVTEHVVQVVYPVAVEKYILQVAPETGEILGRRRSPKKGTIYEMFSELIRLPSLITHENFYLDVVLIIEEEIRCPDGKGSWRRKGVSIVDRKLVEVVKTVSFCRTADFAALIPADVGGSFSNKELAKTLKIPVRQAQKVTYTLRHAQIIEKVAKRGNEFVYALVS